MASNDHGESLFRGSHKEQAGKPRGAHGVAREHANPIVASSESATAEPVAARNNTPIVPLIRTSSDKVNPSPEPGTSLHHPRYAKPKQEARGHERDHDRHHELHGKKTVKKLQAKLKSELGRKGGES